MNFSRFRSIRARLLAVMLFILLPIAALSLILATTTYRSVIAAIQIAQTELVSNYAVRTRVWLQGNLRMALASAAAIVEARQTTQECTEVIRNLTTAVVGVNAMAVSRPGQDVCGYTVSADVTWDALTSLLDDQRIRPAASLSGSLEAKEARYDVATLGGRLQIVIYGRLPDSGEGRSDILALIDPDRLNESFDIGELAPGTIVALVKRGQQVVVARGAPESDRVWLPTLEVAGSAVQRAAWVDGTGTAHTYATQVLGGPDLYILSRFDGDPAQAAFTQFLVLALLPLVTLAVLFVAYAWFIQHDIVQWIQAIGSAASGRSHGRFQRVIISDAMPLDLRQVAGAYNALVDDADEREARLQEAAAGNLALVRELNHRVKNSLQVIQSYLALSRRQNRGIESLELLEAESKVMVLSTAYRLALRDGTLDLVPVKPFVEEIVVTLSTHLRSSEQWVDVTVSQDVFPLFVDRAIPLGLALVESVAATLRSGGRRTVHVKMSMIADDRAELLVECDEKISTRQPPPKIMAGLAAQIGAVVKPSGAERILNWVLTR